MKESNNDTTATRRTVLKGTATAAVAATGATAASGTAAATQETDTLSSSILADAGWGGFEVVDSAARYGAQSHPQFIVKISSAEDKSTLTSWVDESDKRTLNKSITETEHVVTAPAMHVVASGLINREVDALASLSYVKSIDYNLTYEAQVVDTLETSDSWQAPPYSELVTVSSDGVFSAAGLAYSDNSESQPLNTAVSYAKQGETADGSGITVAVLDSGCNKASDDSVFGNRITEAKNFRTGEVVDTSLSSPDWSKVADGTDSYHGTWCTAAVGANPSDSNYVGAAPAADLMVGKVMSDSGQGDTADIIEGVRWAVNNGADVISLSLGAPIYSETLADELDAAVEAGCLVVVAAGNSRQSVRWVGSPADTQTTGVLTVGATDNAPKNSDGLMEMRSAYFSQVGPDGGATDGSMGDTRGANPNIACSGVRVEALVPDTDANTTTKTLSGTSMATPQIAGGAAALLSADGGLVGNPAEAHARLTDYARPAPSCGTTEVGDGILALDLAINQTDPSTTQKDSRTDEATHRDLANESYSGSFVESWFLPRE